MSHVPWYDTQNLWNLAKSPPKRLAAKLTLPKITYKSKVKIHGTNAVVRCSPRGKVIPGSRNRDLFFLLRDNHGFAAWVEERKEWFSTFCNLPETVLIYGEFFGQGICSGVSASQVRKSFAVFALKLISDDREVDIWGPQQIQDFLGELPNDMYIIPWDLGGREYVIDFSNCGDNSEVSEAINRRVEEVENCDPLIASIFGVEGLGEGLVFFPQDPHHSWTNAFKAKGKKHRTSNKKPGDMDVPKVSGDVISAYADLVITQGRLEQGASEVGGFDIKLTSNFLGWIARDLIKETRAELEGLGVQTESWKHAISGAVARARDWWLGNCRQGDRIADNAASDRILKSRGF